MKGIALDFHGWRGVFLWKREADLFHFRITFFFVTLWVCKFCVHERINKMAKAIGR